LLSKTIKKEPDDLKVPTQCVGCHFGDKQFEPERSFPREARPGPRGIRSLYVSENLKNESIARGISEHAKRSDNVLGLYATLFLSDLSTRIRKGASSEREQALAKKLGILDNSN